MRSSAGGANLFQRAFFEKFLKVTGGRGFGNREKFLVVLICDLSALLHEHDRLELTIIEPELGEALITQPVAPERDHKMRAMLHEIGLRKSGVQATGVPPA